MMEGNPTKYRNFVLHPEYWGKTTHDLRLESQDNDDYHVASQPFGGEVRLFVYHNDWLVHERAKCRLHHSEREDGLTPGRERPRTVRLGGRNVLILICYELVFPQDYLMQNLCTQNKVDLVLHMVGRPMNDEAQREGWVAIQRSLSLLYRCSVVCCCGGKKGRMNITGVIGAE